MKRKPNIIDLAIILVVIIVIAVLGFVLKGKLPGNKVSGTEKTIVVEILQKEKSFFDEVISEGDAVLSQNNNEQIGTIESKEAKPSKSNTISTELGKIVESEIPGRYDILLTIHYTNHTTDMKIGSSLSVSTKDYICSGYIVDIMDKKEAK